MTQVKDEIYVYSMDGKRLSRVAPSFVGAASLGGKRSQPFFFATLIGFTNPGIVGRYDFAEQNADAAWSIYRTTYLKGLNANDFEAEQVRVAVLFVGAMAPDIHTGLVLEQRWHEGTYVCCTTQRHTT